MTFKVGSPVRYYSDLKGFWVRAVIVGFAASGTYAFLNDGGPCERLLPLTDLILLA